MGNYVSCKHALVAVARTQGASKIDATEIAAIIAFGGVIVSAAVAYMTASRSVYVNAITTARIKWIEGVRQLIAELRDICIKISFGRSRGHEVEKEAAHKAVQVLEELRLTLGRGQIESNIIALAHLCVNSTADYTLTQTYVEKLAEHTKFLFEIEWKRVKEEAAPKLLRVRGYDSMKLLREYKIYYRRQGSFPGCNAGSIHASLSPASAARP